MPNSIKSSLAKNSGGLIAEEIQKNFIPKEAMSQISEDIEQSIIKQQMAKIQDPPVKDISLEMPDGKTLIIPTGNNEVTIKEDLTEEEIKSIAENLPLPTYEEFLQVIKPYLVVSIEAYNAGSKKTLKQYPKKQQKNVKLVLDVQLLSELTYQAFKSGFEWKNKKVEIKE